jgi:hypothetical protein
VLVATLLILIVWCLHIARTAQPASMSVLRQREHRQTMTLHRVTGTVRFFGRHPWLLRYGRQRWVARRELRRARVWVRVVGRELAETRLALRPPVTDWVARQIAAATVIGRESGGDPWPNCPDPFDGGGSWWDTVQCENGGSWLDSPGYFRCGLQFDPGWERRFGRLCP